nr:OstA-like protein [Flavobacterium lotistagni]
MLLFGTGTLLAQSPKKIIVEHADFLDVNQTEIPDALLLQGNVNISHDGAIMFCNKAYYFQSENYVKAFGDVRIIQGDTLFLNSKYAEYSGNVKRAYATGDVQMRSPEMSLATDTLNFDRVSQQAYYNTNGTIINKDNVLKSKSGRYYANEKKFQFLSAVTITNPKYVVKSNRLDYYSGPGHSHLMGPSTITSKENFIYTEKGFYDSKKNIGHFLNKSYIKYKDRLIRGDSLYYNRNNEFASATNNVKITDTINKGIIKGHYAEVYKKKDSLFVTKRAVAISLIDKDSIYIHGKILMVTGKPNERIVRAYNNARIFKKDLSGKCDSIHSSQITNLTKLIGKPILWNFENQMTGDVMHLVGNDNTQKLDSLKVLNNAFIISKDSLGTGYNQVKGQNLYGKFRDNKLYEADIVKNTEVIYFMRNDAHELIGINKNVSSKINMTMDGNTIDSMTFFTNVDGDIYPEKDLPENARKLRGFVWRDDERIKTKDDLFTKEDNELDAQIQEAKKIRLAKDSIQDILNQKQIEDMLAADQEAKKQLNPQKALPQTKSFYESLFEKYDNRILIDKNSQALLVKDRKFRFPANAKSIDNYKKNNPKFRNEIKIDKVLWDYGTMQFGPYDGGYFNEGKVEETENISPKLTYDDIFERYNNRIIMDKNGQQLLIRNFKLRFPTNAKSFANYKKNNPKYRKEIRINKVLWDYKTMQFGKYDGGYFDEGKVVETEIADKNLTYEQIFAQYNNRIIIDKNGETLLIKDNKFRFPTNGESFANYKKNNPEFQSEVLINKVLWDYKTMQFGPYDGGYLNEGKVETKP